MKKMSMILVCMICVPALAQWDQEFTNLEVMAKDTTPAQMRTKMYEFTRSLNVRCAHCHVGEPGAPMDQWDFASDEKEPKRVAREMMRMVEKINGTFLVEAEAKVNCKTCHRGLRNPESLASLMNKAYEKDGLAAAMDTYARLHERHYGRGSYDFGPWPLNQMAADLAREGKRDEANYLNTFNLRYNPDFLHARFWVARAAFEAGDRLHARNEFAKLSRKTSNLGDWMNRYAYELKSKNQADKGLQILMMTTQLVPTYANGFDSAGEFLAEMGQKEKAIEYYTRALQVDPSLESSKKALATLKGE